MTSVLDFKPNHHQVIRDLTDFSEGLVDENAILQDRIERLRTRSGHQARLLESVLSHNDSLIKRLDFWRGKSLYAFAAGLLLGSGAIAAATLDVWQILDRALQVVGL